MNVSRNVGTALLLGLVGALVGLALLAIFVLPIGAWASALTGDRPAAQAAGGNSADGGGAKAASGGGEQPQASQNQAANTEPVSKERAGEIAVEHLGGGRVTYGGREDDHGARWEIEVTKQDGSEADVYVASDGGVAHVNQKGQGDEAGTGGAQQQQQEPAQAQTIDAQQAGEIAASHVGGTADTVLREADGDYGAAWDVDVYAPEGEYTIYLSATGDVVRVEGPFRD